jgi:hypothetical protein
MEGATNESGFSTNAMSVRIGRIGVCVTFVDTPYLAIDFEVFFKDVLSIKRLPLRDPNTDFDVGSLVFNVFVFFSFHTHSRLLKKLNSI